MIGELGALGCAPLWAISSIMLKSQSHKVDAVQINAIRALFAGVFAVAVLLFTGKFNQIYNLPLSAVVYLLLAVVIGFIFGDTLFIKGMSIIGVSKALPISVIYPVFVLPFSIIFVGETMSIITLAGLFITILGLVVLTYTKKSQRVDSALPQKQYWHGIALVILATIFWAGGTITLKLAIDDLDPIVAGAVRMPFMAIILYSMVFVKNRNIKLYYGHDIKSFMILGLAGVLGIGLGGLLFMIGVKYAGATKTAVLSTTSPLFGIPLSMVILHEKITVRTVIGAVLCIFGIWLVV